MVVKTAKNDQRKVRRSPQILWKWNTKKRQDLIIIRKERNLSRSDGEEAWTPVVVVVGEYWK